MITEDRKQNKGKVETVECALKISFMGVRGVKGSLFWSAQNSKANAKLFDQQMWIELFNKC